MTRTLVMTCALLVSVLTAQAADAPPAPALKRTVLSRSDVPNSNYEVVLMLVEAPPHMGAGRHIHPGKVTGYVIDGEYTMIVEGEPPKVLKAGEHLELDAGVVHDERTQDLSAKLLVLFTVEKGKPLTTPVKAQ